MHFAEFCLFPGSYYPLGTKGTVPKAYDIFRTYEETEGRKINIKMKKIGKYNTK
jgi:hypothetical protein